jgi:hypothetical protein
VETLKLTCGKQVAVCRWGHPGRALMGASCAGQPDIFWEEWLEAVSRGAAFRGTIEAHSAAEN